MGVSCDQHRPLVLVVDDEPTARSATRRVLMSYGYDVLEAEDGKQALEVIATEPPVVGLAICDINMPGMGGLELARKLRTLKPDLPTLFMCGYPPETIKDIPAEAMVIEKPFTHEDLEQAVVQTLDAAGKLNAAD